MSIVVLGSGGQVGRALLARLGDYGIGLDVPEADFTQPDALVQRIRALRPKIIINAAAYTAVDQAEKDEARALQINATTPAIIAKFFEVPFVHFSTDYVYSGSGSEPRTESEPPAPLNVYGHTKAEGDRLIAESAKEYLILRTSWVYDAHGKNFFKTMLKLGSQKEELSVVSDQIGAPTYAPHWAEATLGALGAARKAPRFPSGVYHLCSEGETSWHGFAEAIFAQARGLAVKTVHAIPSAEYPTPAKRPLNSRLSCAKITATLGVKMPHWKQGLEACYREATAS